MLATTARQASLNRLFPSSQTTLAFFTAQNTPALALAALSRQFSSGNAQRTQSTQACPEVQTKPDGLAPVDSTVAKVGTVPADRRAWLKAEKKRFEEQLNRLRYPEKEVKCTPALREVKGPFTKQEDKKLAQLVQQYGRDWTLISKEFGPTRSKHLLEQHYTNILEPEHINYEPEDPKNYENWSHEEIQRHFFEEYRIHGRKIGKFSLMEHRILKELVRVYGTRFSVIAEIFSGHRTYEQLAFHYHNVCANGFEQYEKTFKEPVVELDIPEGMVTGDPSWTSREVYEMEKIVNRHRQGLPINTSEVALLFPGRTNQELNRMRNWVTADSELRYNHSNRKWSEQEIDLLRQFMAKYGTNWELLYKARILPCRKPGNMALAANKYLRQKTK